MGKSATNGRAKAIRTLLSTALAALLTGFVYFVDQTRQGVAAFELNRTLTREIASQVEGVSLGFRERGDPDSLSSAIRSMQSLVTTQASPQARLIRIDRAPAQKTESFRMDSVERIAELSRPVFLESSAGVRVRLRTEYPGLFGAKSRATNDATVLLVFACLFILSYRALAIGYSTKVSRKFPHPIVLAAPPPTRPLDLNAIRSTFKEFATAAKDVAGGAARVRSEARRALDSGSDETLNRAAEDLAKALPSLIIALQKGQRVLDDTEKDQSAA